MIAILQLVVSVATLLLIFKIQRGVGELTEESRKKDELKKMVKSFGDMFAAASDTIPDDVPPPAARPGKKGRLIFSKRRSGMTYTFGDLIGALVIGWVIAFDPPNYWRLSRSLLARRGQEKQDRR